MFMSCSGLFFSSHATAKVGNNILIAAIVKQEENMVEEVYNHKNNIFLCD